MTGKMMNMMYIFNRNGCLYYHEWHRPSSGQMDDHKLMFGLVFSLKSFVQKMDPINGNTNRGCTFHSFRTNTYKLSYMETPSGIKLILISDPRTGDLKEALRTIYTNIFVEHIVKNPLCTPGEPFKCEAFETALDAYVRTLQ
eukprot:TRINITY_DN35785_c0_g1_i1.p1 TRINITY_DN35785_c0_g1~~TRINITY_DN35785_c0_g1_i1.p1  ORF type:complete len:142 (-),score=26.49 TRINITY_DN35785_c0_g1_i1:1580-2005(-)